MERDRVSELTRYAVALRTMAYKLRFSEGGSRVSNKNGEGCTAEALTARLPVLRLCLVLLGNAQNPLANNFHGVCVNLVSGNDWHLPGATDRHAF